MTISAGNYVKIISPTLGTFTISGLKTDGLEWNDKSVLKKTELTLTSSGKLESNIHVDPSGSREPLIIIKTVQKPSLIDFLTRIENEEVRVVAFITTWDRERDVIAVLKELPKIMGVAIDIEINFLIKS
jgi:hypothetical protein